MVAIAALRPTFRGLCKQTFPGTISDFCSSYFREREYLEMQPNTGENRPVFLWLFLNSLLKIQQTLCVGVGCAAVRRALQRHMSVIRSPVIGVTRPGLATLLPLRASSFPLHGLVWSQLLFYRSHATHCDSGLAKCGKSQGHASPTTALSPESPCGAHA